MISVGTGTGALHVRRLAGHDDWRLPSRIELVDDLATGLRWQRAVPPETFQFEAARSYCDHLTLGDTRRWRVPTLGEILTLIDERAAAAPMIDACAFPDTPGEPFWTSSTFGNGPDLAWYVRFDQGNGLYGRLIEPFRVRCVSAPSPP